MLNKKLILLLIFLLSILAVGTVSAESNITSELGSDYDDNAAVLKEDQSDLGNFDDLSREIDETEEGSILNLTRDYMYTNGSSDGIKINKTITINGNNHRIDANHQSRIFATYEGNITLNNLVLVNGFAGKGGAIFTNNTITLNNVTFVNNHADEGGAVYAQVGLNADNCIFDSNQAKDGAAIYVNYIIDNSHDMDDNASDENESDWDDDINITDDDDYNPDDDYDPDDDDYNPDDDYDPDDDDYDPDDEPETVYGTIISNSVFKNSSNIFRGMLYLNMGEATKIINSSFINSTSEYGAAIHVYNTELSILNTTFTDLQAKKSGGAISLASLKTKMIVDNCSFTNTSSLNNGGAICADTSYFDLLGDGTITINNTRFINSKSKFGGALVIMEGFINIENSIFKDNCAEYSGGACYFACSKVNIANSTFTSNKLNSTDYKGSAINSFGEELNIDNSRFINNPSTAIYIAQNTFSIVNCNFSNNIKAISTSYSDGELDGNIYGGDEVVENDNEGYYLFTIDGEGIDLDLIKNEINVTSLPSRFDAREWGWVSHVKDQGDSGACWVFATMSALETAILKSTGVEYNLSIQKLHKLIQKFSKYGSRYQTEGGDPYIAGHWLVSWYGALMAEEDEFDLYGRIINPIISNNSIHVSDIVWIEKRKNATDNDAMKRDILKYGAITAGINLRLDLDYYNNVTSALYCYEKTGPGHAVCIVGWDDNYSASNFKITPPGDGAWIIKDSYGEYERDHGYIYVSYYDMVIGYYSGDVAFVFDNWENYNKNYQTDIGGEQKFINTTIDEYKNPLDYENYTTAPVDYILKNVYTSIGDDFISAIGTYFNLDEKYTIEIYVNGKLKHTQNGISPFKGYHTVKLTKNVPVHAGDEFSAIIKKSMLPLVFDSNVIPQSGKSIVNDGTGWIDLSTVGLTATLKVYTKPLVNLTYQITVNNVNTVYNGGKYLTVNVKDVYGDALKGVKVTIKLSNGISKTFTTDSKGQVKFSTNNLKVNTYSATITLDAFGKYVKATKTAKITVKKATPKLTAKKKTFKKSVKTKKYKITLKTNRNKVMKNIKVTLKVKGKTYYAKTNSKGKATFKIKKLIKKGTYKAIVKFKGNKYYNAKTVKAKIIVK